MLRRLFPGVYEGWLVVGSAAFTVLIVSASFFYGFGTIFNELIDEFGWSVAATSFASSLRSEVGGIVAPFVGNAIDRLGAQRVIIAGVIVSAAGVMLMSFVQEIWQFYACMVFIAFGTSASGGQVGIAAIATWFETRRAFAMSFMTVGGGIGGLFVVVIAWLVEQYGWRDALRMLSLVILVVGLVIGSNTRMRPRSHPQPMDGRRTVDALGVEVRPMLHWGIPWMRVIRTRAALTLALGLTAVAFGTTSIVILLIPYLETEIGLSKSVAGTSMAVFTASSIVGRLGFGYLADRYPKRLMLAASTALVCAGLPVLAVADSYPVALVGILLIAPGFGGSIPVRPALLADYFGTRYFGTINGLGALTMTTGGAVGPLLVGYFVDQTGSYEVGWWLSAAVTVFAIPAFLATRPPTELIEHYRREAQVEADGEIAEVPTLAVDRA